MDNEIILDVGLIEEHYKNLVSGVEECSDPIAVIYDDETNLSVKTDSQNAYDKSVSLENLIKECITADAEHLNKLGESFLTMDANLSININNMLSYE